MSPTALSIVVFLVASWPALATTGAYPVAGINHLTAGGGGKCTYEYKTHSGHPVVTSATCHISRKDVKKGGNEPNHETQLYARQLGSHDGCDTDDAGHILANHLGGMGTEPINIMPQGRHLNRGAWKGFEDSIYRCMTKRGGATKATLKYTWTYSSSTRTRPKTMTYEASYDKGCKHNLKSFINHCNHFVEDDASEGEGKTTTAASATTILLRGAELA